MVRWECQRLAHNVLLVRTPAVWASLLQTISSKWLLAKNAFDKKYTTSVTLNNDSSIGYDGMGEPRWIGVVLHTKF